MGRGKGKVAVLGIVERKGRVHPKCIPDVTAKTLHLHNAIIESIDSSARVFTDDCPSYKGIGKHFQGGHQSINHSAGEYAHGDVTTNSVEVFFSIFFP